MSITIKIIQFCITLVPNLIAVVVFYFEILLCRNIVIDKPTHFGIGRIKIDERKVGLISVDKQSLKFFIILLVMLHHTGQGAMISVLYEIVFFYGHRNVPTITIVELIIEEY